MKQDTLQHPKLLLLARRLDIPRPYAAGLLESIWLFTGQYTPNGRIGKYTPAMVAELIGYPGDPDTLFQALAETGWLDNHPEGARIHDWPDHCDDAVHMRLARAGKRFANGRAPKLTRLSHKERLQAEALLQANDARRAHNQRTAQKTASTLITTPAAPATPCPTSPTCPTCPTGPTPPTPANSPSSPVSIPHSTLPIPHSTLPIPHSTLPIPHSTLPIPHSTLPIPHSPTSPVRLAREILALTGEGRPAAGWWLETIRRMRDTGGIEVLGDALRHAADCADPAIRHAKSLDPLDTPGGYLAGKCRDHLANHGRTLPGHPDKMLLAG